MIKLLLASLTLASSAGAQEIRCPERYPVEGVRLAKEAAGGGGFVTPAPLSFATIQTGELYSRATEVPPESKKFNGGWVAQYRFTPQEPRWLVCRYGGNEWAQSRQMTAGTVEWWGMIDSRATSCELRVEEIAQRPYPTRWAAAAICKGG